MKLIPILHITGFLVSSETVENSAHSDLNAAIDPNLDMLQFRYNNKLKTSFRMMKGAETGDTCDAEPNESPLRILTINDCPPESSTASRYPMIDGTCNNRLDRRRGKAKFPLKRLLPAAYEDDGNSVRVSVTNNTLPSARFISTMLHRGDRKASKLSHMFTQWGQFITHDIVHTPISKNPDGSKPACKCFDENENCLTIPIPESDIQRRTENKECFTIIRSLPVPDAQCESKTRNQLTQISAYIDATTVYGTSQELLETLRDWDSDSGQLLVDTDKNGQEILPHQGQRPDDNTKPFACPHMQNLEKKPCMLAGDVRINENVGLASTHVLFMREHNRIARELKRLNKDNPKWDSERIFQETRLIIIAMHQHINYNEYLPKLLGSTVMKRYGLFPTTQGYYFGYDASFDASISNEFTTAALRFGHAMVNDDLARVLTNWEKEGTSRMKDGFFHPFELYKTGEVGKMLRGLTQDPSLKADTVFGEDLLNFLFTEHKSKKFGKDLFSINIARGRDHGLRPYNDYRALCGLPRAKTFDELTNIPKDIVSSLKNIYEDVNDIDLYVGGLAEKELEGAAVGPTFACILADQFRDLKRGDRFWYENGGCEVTFSPRQLKAINKGVSLAGLMCECAHGTESIARDVFLFDQEKVSCSDIPKLDLSAWKDPYEFIGENKFQEMDTAEWSVWFPSVDGRWDLQTIYDARPNDVCLNALNTQTRFKTNPEKKQVRFMCPTGQIRTSDVPKVPASTNNQIANAIWTVWFDLFKPRFQEDYDDTEEFSRHLKERPNQICKHPIAIQAQTLNGTFALETGDVFEAYDYKNGLVCRGKHQINGECNDYRVRYLCAPSEIGNVQIESGFVKAVEEDLPGDEKEVGLARWTEWVSSSNNVGMGDVEYIDQAIKTENADFCRKQDVLQIQVRTVNDHKSPAETGDVFRHFNIKRGLVCYNSDQSDGKACDNYEIRVFCKYKMASSFNGFGSGLRSRFGLQSFVSSFAKEQARDLCDKYSMCCGDF